MASFREFNRNLYVNLYRAGQNYHARPCLWNLTPKTPLEKVHIIDTRTSRSLQPYQQALSPRIFNIQTISEEMLNPDKTVLPADRTKTIPEIPKLPRTNRLREAVGRAAAAVFIASAPYLTTSCISQETKVTNSPTISTAVATSSATRTATRESLIEVPFIGGLSPEQIEKIQDKEIAEIYNRLSDPVTKDSVSNPDRERFNKWFEKESKKVGMVATANALWGDHRNTPNESMRVVLERIYQGEPIIDSEGQALKQYLETQVNWAKAGNTPQPLKSPTPIPTKTPEIKPTPIIPKDTPTPEIKIKKWPEVIGNLATDGYEIHNIGNDYGIILKDPEELARIARRVNRPTIFEIYDSNQRNLIPDPSGTNYIIKWDGGAIGSGFPGSGDGNLSIIKRSDGVKIVRVSGPKFLDSYTNNAGEFKQVVYDYAGSYFDGFELQYLYADSPETSFKLDAEGQAYFDRAYHWGTYDKSNSKLVFTK